MLASAAARLGLRTAVVDPDPECPAAQVANVMVRGAYDDPAALAELARISDVITYEFENVPVAPLRRLAAIRPVHPPVEALEVSQDRVTEKAFLNGVGIATAPWRAVDDAEELEHALVELGGDCILKTRRFGYDGKGQVWIHAIEDAPAALESLGGRQAILEAKATFVRELSVIAARDWDGHMAVYPLGENRHEGGILRLSRAPAGATAALNAEAEAIARRILEGLDYVGVMGVELFELADGRLLVNEIAPRVHNSGHWTQEGCVVDQFEQHIRAVAGLPLGNGRRHADVVMENLIGDDMDRLPELLQAPDTQVHLYGKAEVKPGRKMGHVNRILRGQGA